MFSAALVLSILGTDSELASPTRLVPITDGLAANLAGLLALLALLFALLLGMPAGPASLALASRG